MSFVVAAAAKQREDTLRQWIADATAYAHFCGPDGDGVEVWEGSGLGHALLRIDSTQVAQPLSTDGDVWISADARLDDRIGLIRTLRSFGRPLHGDEDDAEVLLAAYAT